MRLDDGEETVFIKTEECVLQRGAMHLWFNHGKEPCRMLCILVGSDRVVTQEGKELDAFFPARPKS